jgi:hypothetical protein
MKDDPMRPASTKSFVRALRPLDAGEEGMLSLASLFVVLGFLALFGLLANAGMVTSRKLETQNAADSTAYAASIEMARGLNSITAINHIIGELTGLVILIHTLGGDQEDGASAPTTPQTTQYRLEMWYYMADLVGEDTLPVLDGVYDEVKKDSKLGGAIGDARLRLKDVFTWSMQSHWIGGMIAQGQYIPYVGVIFEAIGDSIIVCTYPFEGKVYEECYILDGLEYLTTYVLKYFKEFFRDIMIPFLYYYGEAIVWLTPYNAYQAYQAVGPPNLADTALYPWFPTLPVHQENTQLSNAANSQLVRASTPWVQWWRQPWLEFGRNALILSRFACFFQDRSTEFTITLVNRFKQGQYGFGTNINLYVLDGLDSNNSNKTNEPWTSGQNSRDWTDAKFCVLGLAHRPAPNMFSTNIYKYQENPDGFVCYAQAMAYNANPQQQGSGNGTWQPIAGWDTLNWSVQVPEHPGPGSPDNACGTPSVPQPQIQLNWQSKLVPSTRINEWESRLQWGPTRPVLWRTVFDMPITGTH